MIVLDANILIRAVLGRRVRQLLEFYAARGVQFCAPDIAYTDAAKYLPALLAKRSIADTDVDGSLQFLRLLVKPIVDAIYEEFEIEARERLRGRDEEDWPILASALALACPIWSEDMDFFGAGIAVWTTSRIEIYLKAEAKASDSEVE